MAEWRIGAVVWSSGAGNDGRCRCRSNGLPVIAAEATGSTNLVDDGVTGTLVHGADSKAFAAALESYAKKPATRRKHGKAGLAVAETMDWESINSVAVKAYLHAIVKRKRLDRLKNA